MSTPRKGRWRVVAGAEMSELWGSTKGPAILFGYSLVLAALSYLASSNAGINLLDARESVGLVVKVAIGLGALAALVVSADAISGERERGTLESLLLTPAPRRDLVVGKLLSANTMWLGSLAVALPFVVVLGRGPAVIADAVGCLLVAGALVSVALTALGLAVSARSMSNRVSLAISVAVLLLLTAPSQLPALTSGGLGTTLVKVNPVSAGLQLADNVVIKQQAWTEQGAYLLAPLAAALVLSTLAVMSARSLELGGSR